MDTVSLVRTQLEEMDRHKWIESEKAGRDLGEEALLEWIDLYVEEFLQDRPPSLDNLLAD